MEISQDLTLREVAERLARARCKLSLHSDHGVYHAYVHGETTTAVRGYDRGDLAEAIDGATKQL